MSLSNKLRETARWFRHTARNEPEPECKASHIECAVDCEEAADEIESADARIAELELECSQWREELRIYRETENARIAGLDRAVTVRDTEIARLETDLELARRDERERNSLRDFANDVMESWPHGDVDGCDLERMAVDHGLLALKDPKPTEPCGDNCACSGYPSPEEWAGGVDCYVRTPLLTGSIDAARAGNGGE